MRQLVHRRDLLRAFVVGAAVNLPWELAHSLLYRDLAGATWGQHLICCGVAALVDGVGIAAIYGIGAILFGEARWTRHPSPARLGLTAALGFAGAVATEWLALGLGWWDYNSSMPRLPGLNLGMSPLAQFVVLPLAVLFWMLPRWWARRDSEARRRSP